MEILNPRAEFMVEQTGPRKYVVSRSPIVVRYYRERCGTIVQHPDEFKERCECLKCLNDD